MRYSAAALVMDWHECIVVANQSCYRNFTGLLRAMEG
jgi:hypothetical protein